MGEYVLDDHRSGHRHLAGRLLHRQPRRRRSARDRDGWPEIGVAGKTKYAVFRRDGQLLWQADIFDLSSSFTGSTTFDFDLDGQIEVVYRDERNLWIYRGSDGAVLQQLPMPSSTWSELPVVADVDGDGHAEIVVVADTAIKNELVTPRELSGIYVLEDPLDRWPATRKIWNQHSYHVTNVNDDGTIPLVERPSWLEPGLNGYRLNTLPAGEARHDTLTYRVTAGAAESNEATVSIELLPPRNVPRTVSTPPLVAHAGLQYT